MMWIVRGVCDFGNLVLDTENKLTAQSSRMVGGKGGEGGSGCGGGGNVGKGD